MNRIIFVSLVLVLAWAAFVLGNALGPEPNRSGVNGLTCNIAGCHVGNPVNSGGGRVAISGLPGEWTPSQTYALQVVVTLASARRFGFQMTAVDSNGQQAGTLIAGTDGRTSVVSAPAGAATLQHVQHVLATSANTFNFSWRAPASASVGNVRFNVAGNAANGDSNNTGDFIYTAQTIVPAAAVTDNSTRNFSISDRGGVSLLTEGGSGATVVGYARIQANTQSTTPAGLAVFGFRQNNVLVTEAGVPASPLVQSGRIYAEVNGPINTGLAIANPNSQAATVTFFFTNASGQDFGQGSTTIPANGQIARFLNEAPFNGGSSISGTFTFNSSVPVSVIALRGFANERQPSEFLITTLPVSDLSAPAAETIFFPHFADGGGWTTQVVLVNPTDQTMSGTVQFFSQGSGSTAGQPLTLNVDGQTNSSFSYSIAARTSRRLQTSGSAGATQAGSIRVVPAANNRTTSGLGIFSFRVGGVTVTEAGVPALRASTAFRVYAEASGTLGQPGSIQTGIAIVNPSASSANVNFELTRLDGSSTGLTGTAAVPASGQVAMFLNQIQGLGALPLPFQGVLRISTSSSAGVSVVGLRGRYNERVDFLITTTAPINESSVASSAEQLFPHLAEAGGYTTQFVLFSGLAGQSSAGTLRFFNQSGQALSLTLR